MAQRVDGNIHSSQIRGEDRYGEGDRLATVASTATTSAGQVALFDALGDLYSVDPTVGGSGSFQSSIAVSRAGTAIGTRPRLNFIAGTGVAYTINDNSGDNRIDITIEASGSGGGGGALVRYGTWSDHLLASVDGVWYFTNSIYSHAVADGGTWHYFIANFGEVNPPNLSNFTWTNQSTATAISTYGGIYLIAASVGSRSINILSTPAPTPPYTVEIGIIRRRLTGALSPTHLGWRQASNGRLASIVQYSTFDLNYETWNSATSKAGDYIVNDNGWASQGFPNFFRFSDDGTTNRVTYATLDRYNIRTLQTVTRTSHLTPDELFVGVEGWSSAQLGAHFFHYQQIA